VKEKDQLGVTRRTNQREREEVRPRALEEKENDVGFHRTPSREERKDPFYKQKNAQLTGVMQQLVLLGSLHFWGCPPGKGKEGQI